MAAGAPGGPRTLWMAIGVSLLLHAVLLSLHFKFPEASRTLQDKALDIILVNARSARKPTEAQALAQANLDGGGNSERNRRARTPLPPSQREQSGNDLEQTQKRVQALEAQQRRLLAQARGKQALPPAEEVRPQPSPEPSPEPALSGRDLASSALEMARLQGEIARQTDEYNKRPRVKNLGTRAEEYRFARYMEDWRIKIERIGTLNYPEPARGKLSGSLWLTVISTVRPGTACSTRRRGASCAWPSPSPSFRPTSAANSTCWRSPAPGPSPAATRSKRDDSLA